MWDIQSSVLGAAQKYFVKRIWARGKVVGRGQSWHVARGMQREYLWLVTRGLVTSVPPSLFLSPNPLLSTFREKIVWGHRKKGGHLQAKRELSPETNPAISLALEPSLQKQFEKTNFCGLNLLINNLLLCSTHRLIHMKMEKTKKM